MYSNLRSIFIADSTNLLKKKNPFKKICQTKNLPDFDPDLNSSSLLKFGLKFDYILHILQEDVCWMENNTNLLGQLNISNYSIDILSKYIHELIFDNVVYQSDHNLARYGGC